MSNELVGNIDARDWAHSFVNMFYLVPSEGAMLSWFAGAIEAGRSAGQVPPEWFDRFKVYADADEMMMVECSDCGKDISITGQTYEHPTIRQIIVAATLHRQEKHGGDPD